MFYNDIWLFCHDILKLVGSSQHFAALLALRPPGHMAKLSFDYAKWDRLEISDDEDPEGSARARPEGSARTRPESSARARSEGSARRRLAPRARPKGSPRGLGGVRLRADCAGMRREGPETQQESIAIDPIDAIDAETLGGYRAPRERGRRHLW